MNYICFGKKFNPLYVYYMYIDVNRDHDYIADSLFYKRKIPVHFKDEMVRDEDKYRIIFCKIRKKYRKQFEDALEELKNKMHLLGYTDYEEYCERLMVEIAETE